MVKVTTDVKLRIGRVLVHARRAHLCLREVAELGSQIPDEVKPLIEACEPELSNAVASLEVLDRFVSDAGPVGEAVREQTGCDGVWPPPVVGGQAARSLSGPAIVDGELVDIPLLPLGLREE